MLRSIKYIGVSIEAIIGINALKYLEAQGYGDQMITRIVTLLVVLLLIGVIELEIEIKGKKYYLSPIDTIWDRFSTWLLEGKKNELKPAVDINNRGYYGVVVLILMIMTCGNVMVLIYNSIMVEGFQSGVIYLEFQLVITGVSLLHDYAYSLNRE